MNPIIPSRPLPWVLLAALLIAPTALAQSTAPVPAPVPPVPAVAPTPPRPSPVSSIRNKISAGDLLSAESLLEVHRAKNGEDGPAIIGLSWLARGALLLGEPAKAERYAAEVRERVKERIAAGADIAKDHDLEYALGSTIEVEAQLIERKVGAKDGVKRAAEFVRAELTRWPQPASLRARLNKRLALLTLEGTPAPELVVEDWVGTAPPTLASLRGSPVLLYIWSESCGDCKAQSTALAKVSARHAAAGLKVVALTQYYEDQPQAWIAEKARVDSVWKDVYRDMPAASIVLSNESMVRYGGSSTPTLVFIDRAGIVRRYTPTRLTEAELDRSVAALLK